MGTKFGFDLLYEQVLRATEAEMRYFVATVDKWHSCESEIERLFLASLKFCTDYKVHPAFTWLCVLNDEKQEATALSSGLAIETDILPDGDLLETHRGGSTLYIRPQAVIGDVRVDFLLHSLFNDHRRLIVECDGHDFHERTKEQAARDRARDRTLVLDGYQVFRFTGSELWRDPMRCASQVLEWGCKS